MKAYKVEVLIIDHDLLGPEEIKVEMESVRYPNRCISPHVMSIEEREIGEWDDDHPLNLKATMLASYETLFKREEHIDGKTEPPGHTAGN